ncbi:hypothetical protein DHEL01_v207063 [Diaporthe helianthi]|uniref:Uncharacterized protein n=1 Tax=Diaporthe helianthi TaxID=158607 RepID=A0A2P5HW99_DIAHE|nr:hypothetical protein DHEL01_v207063 [Diaporthe helianthi]
MNGGQQQQTTQHQHDTAAHQPSRPQPATQMAAATSDENSTGGGEGLKPIITTDNTAIGSILSWLRLILDPGSGSGQESIAAERGHLKFCADGRPWNPKHSTCPKEPTATRAEIRHRLQLSMAVAGCCVAVHADGLLSVSLVSTRVCVRGLTWPTLWFWLSTCVAVLIYLGICKCYAVPWAGYAAMVGAALGVALSCCSSGGVDHGIISFEGGSCTKVEQAGMSFEQDMAGLGRTGYSGLFLSVPSFSGGHNLIFSLSKFETEGMQWSEGASGIEQETCSWGPHLVPIRARDGMVTSVGPKSERAWSGSRSQSLRAESGPARNDDLSDWCLPACLARPSFLLPAREGAPALCVLPPPASAIHLRKELAGQARPESPGLGLRLWLLGWAGLVPWGTHKMPCNAMRCDGRDDPSHLNKSLSVQSFTGTWVLSLVSLAATGPGPDLSLTWT